MSERILLIYAEMDADGGAQSAKNGAKKLGAAHAAVIRWQACVKRRKLAEKRARYTAWRIYRGELHKFGRGEGQADLSRAEAARYDIAPRQHGERGSPPPRTSTGTPPDRRTDHPGPRRTTTDRDGPRQTRPRRQGCRAGERGAHAHRARGSGGPEPRAGEVTERLPCFGSINCQARGDRRLGFSSRERYSLPAPLERPERARLVNARSSREGR
jgi:hypothetical protein